MSGECIRTLADADARKKRRYQPDILAGRCIALPLLKTFKQTSHFLKRNRSCPHRSIISAVPAWYSSTLSGPEWQPTSHGPTTCLSTNQSASSIYSSHRIIGTGCNSATAGEILFLSYICLLMVTFFDVFFN